MVRAVCFVAALALLPALAPAQGATKLVRAKGVSLSLPSTWEAFDLTSAQLSQLLSAAGKRNPGIAQMGPALEQAARSGSYRLFAFDVKSVKREFMPNVNILITPAGRATMKDVLKVNREQMQKIGKVTAERPVRVGNLEGYLFETTMPIRQRTGTLPLAIFSYFAIQGTQQLTVTFTTPMDDAARMRSIAAASIKTVRLD